MNITFDGFLRENPNCSKYATYPDAVAVFELLSEERNIIAMIDASEGGKPALSACVFELESFFDALQNPTIDFNDTFTRTVVGRMIKSILAPFGYEVTQQKDLPKAARGKYFTSASCYAKTGAATLEVARRIVPASQIKALLP